MKKIILSFLVIVLSSISIFAQLTPINFRLKNGNISKVNNATPNSNSITDILTVNQTIWLGTSKGLNKSTDGGQSWINYSGNKVFNGEPVISIAYGDSIIWVATGHTEEINGYNLPVGSGIKYSTDNGETWTSLPQPIDAAGDSVIIYGINRIRALPVTTTVNNIAYDIAVTPGTVWIASFAAGLRKSEDRGKTWQRVVLPPDYLNSINPNDTLHFSLQPVSGKFGNENNLNQRVFSIISVNDSTLYVGTAGGINKSTDGGISWVKFNHQNEKNPISGNFITALGYNKFNKTVWAATWKAEKETEFYAVSSSFDGGANWNTFLTGEQAHNFGFEYLPGSSDVFVPTDHGIFLSPDNGESWILPSFIRDHLTNVSIETSIFYSVANQKYDNNNYVWVGSANGLARLTETDNGWGGDWKVFISSGKKALSTETYAFPNPFAPGTELVKIKYNTGGNPVNVTIRIFDFNMNLVKTLLQNAHRSGGNDQIEFWNGRDENNNIVPNGVYFYRIDMGTNKPLYGKIMVLR